MAFARLCRWSSSRAPACRRVVAAGVFSAPRRFWRASRPAVLCPAGAEGEAAGNGEIRNEIGQAATQMAQRDELINLLLACKSPEEFQKHVAQNILSLDQQFWLRVAARRDMAESAQEQERLASLATYTMQLVDAIVKVTDAQMASGNATVQTVLKAAADEDGVWKLPLSESEVASIRQVLDEQDDKLDEAFLSNCYACIAKASGDGMNDMVALLQKVLQLYAARQLTRSADEEAEDAVLRRILLADEQQWDTQISNMVESGELTKAAFTNAIQKKMEFTVLTLQSGSYAQRVQAEYLKEVEERGKKVFEAKASP